MSASNSINAHERWVEPRLSQIYELLYVIGEDNPRIAHIIKDLMDDVNDADAILEGYSE